LEKVGVLGRDRQGEGLELRLLYQFEVRRHPGKKSEFWVAIAGVKGQNSDF